MRLSLFISLILGLFSILFYLVAAFVIYPFYLEYIFGILCLLILIFAVFWGDLPLLSISKAQQRCPVIIKRQLHNLTCLLSVGKVRLVTSGVFADNVYSMHLPLRTPLIIVGNNVASKLNEAECEQMLKDLLIMIKHKRIFWQTLRVVFLLPILIPISFLTTKHKHDSLSWPHALSLIYIIPLKFLLSVSADRDFNEKKKDIYQHLGLGKESSITRYTPFARTVLSELSYFKESSYCVWNSLFSFENKISHQEKISK